MFKILVEHVDYVLAFFLLIMWIIGEIGGILYIRECREENNENGKEKILQHQESIRNKSTIHDPARSKSKRKKLPVQGNSAERCLRER